MALPAEHPPVAKRRIGVLLVNLGTPEGTDYRSVRRYLKEFLSDRRVIEVPRLIWWPILHGPILTFRPAKTGRAYKEIWNEELDESPLRTITRAQAEALRGLYAGDQELDIDWAMRYGVPSIDEKLRALQSEGCDRIVLFPLYPQYSASTTATVCDKAFDSLKTMRWQPAVRTVPSYHDDPAYVETLAKHIRDDLDQLNWEPEVVVASFHGVPKQYLLDGDPYHCFCQKTGRLLGEALGMDAERFRVTFQSRFGPAEWLKPYTDETVTELAGQGVKRMAIVSPGFAADCLETLEEIAIGVREMFIENGGEQFHYIPCLNASEPSIRLLAHLVEKELAGWRSGSHGEASATWGG
ncbi:MAG: ferrochelatase [Pseudomonadota bacterium]